ncbi:hypothetical protein GCM10028815_34670 [Mariniluteicoccus flavus]
MAYPRADRERRQAAPDSNLTTPGGQPIVQSDKRVDLGQPVIPQGGLIEARDAHLSQHLGTDWSVLHELASVGIHLDVYVFPPTPERPHLTLVTSGMSDLPMTVPAGLE